MPTNSAQDFAKQFGKTTAPSTNNNGTKITPQASPVASFAGQFGNGQGSKTWYEQQKATPEPTPPAPKANVFQKIGNFLSTTFSNISPKTETLKSIQQTPTPEFKINGEIKPNLTSLEVGKSKESDQSAKLTPEAQKKYSEEGQKAVRQKNKEEVASVTRTKLKEGYKEPGILGGIVESLFQSSLNAVSSLGATSEMVGQIAGYIPLIEAGQKIQKESDKIIAKNPEWNPPENQKWGPDKIARVTTAAVPSLLAVIGSGIVAGPIGVVVTGFSLEGGSTYKEAIDSGSPERKAQVYGVIVGSVNSLLERIFPDELLSGPAKTAKNKVIKSLSGKVLDKIIDFNKKGLLEGGTEVLQQLVSNVVATNYDENRKLWDGMLESFVGGHLAGGIAGQMEGKVQYNQGSSGNENKETPIINNETIPKVESAQPVINKETPVETPQAPPKKVFTKQELPTVEELTSHKEQLINTIVQEKLAGNDQFVDKLIDKTNVDLTPDHYKALEEAILEADKKVAVIQGKPIEQPKTEVKPEIKIEEQSVNQFPNILNIEEKPKSERYLTNPNLTEKSKLEIKNDKTLGKEIVLQIEKPLNEQELDNFISKIKEGLPKFNIGFKTKSFGMSTFASQKELPDGTAKIYFDLNQATRVAKNAGKNIDYNNALIEKISSLIGQNKQIVKNNISEVKPEVVKAVFGKNKGLPILDNIQIKDGKMNFTDLTHFVSLNTTKENGLYKMVGKDLIKDNGSEADFPDFINEEQKPVFSLFRDDLVNAFNKMIPAISGDPNRPVLGTIHIQIKDGKLNMFATDGYKLTYRTTGAVIPENISTEFNIEGKNLDKFVKLLDNNKIDVSEGANSVKFANESGFVEVRKTPDQFPNASLVFSKGFKNEIIIDKSELASALKEIAPYAKNNANVISADIKGEDLIIHSEYKELGGNGDTIKKDVKVSIVQKEIVNIDPGLIQGSLLMPVRLETGSEEMMNGTGFNYKFLEDVLKTITGNQIRMDYNELGDLAPVHFSDRTENNIKPKTEEIKKEKGPVVSKGENASAGNDLIGNFEEVPVKNESNNFKLYTKVSDLIDKYAKTIGEGYLPKRAAGVFYTDTKNIRINGMNNLSTATHEISHFLDDHYKISDKLKQTVGETINGRPIYDSTTKAIRKEITNLYTEYYVGGKKSDPLKKRVVEGFATLIQKYVEQPTTIEQKYPNLVTEFLKENGKFYEPVIGDILKDVRGFISEYQGLDPLDKIGSRITSKNIVYDKPSFMNLGDKVREQMADRVYPIEKLGKLTKTINTTNDVSLYIRQYQQINGIISTNLVGKHGYFRYVNGGEFQKTLDFNWKNLIKNLSTDKTTDSFGYYLVARASYYDFELLNEYKNNVLDLKTQIDEAGGMEEAKLLKSEDGISLFDEYNQAKVLMDEQNSMLQKDGITEKEANEAYLKNKDRFSKDESMFDQLVAQDLDLLHESDVGLISDKTFEELKNKKGYASRKRQFFDEIVGEDKSGATSTKVGKTTISSLLRRKGSARTIINPVYSSIRNHSEIVKKSYRQVVYNKMNDVLAPLLPELAQPQKVIRSIQKNGSFRYPQDKDQNIIMGRQNGKRVPVLWDNKVKSIIDDLITPANYGTFENILLSVSRTFTKGTTGLFPAFALTNWLGDQITATANTTNNYKPLASSLNQMSKAIFKKESAEANYFLEYTVLGGERQTFAHWQDLSPEELTNKISNERKGLLKVADLINGGLDILAIPSSYSEIATRATEYIKSRKAGKSQIVALEEAGRVTAPFHHVGKWGGQFGRVAIKSLPFFNPSLQVLDQTLRTASTAKGRMRMGLVLSAITAATIGAFVLMMSDATDDQKRAYKDLEAGELVKYIWLPASDGKTLIKIKVQEFGILGSLINLGLANKYLDANYKVPDFIDGAMQILPGQFQIQEPMLALLSWIPPMIKVPLMTGLNLKDYPKIMPLESTYLQGLPSGLRANESTSYMAKKLGELTGLSPIKTDYLVTGIFGRSSGFILGKSAAYNPLSQVTRAEYWTSGRTIQAYYDLKTKNDQDYSAIKNKIGSFNAKEKNNTLILHQRILTIDKFLKQYRDVDAEKNPQRANDLRNSIIKQIDQLNDTKNKQTSFRLVKQVMAAEGENSPALTFKNSDGEEVTVKTRNPKITAEVINNNREIVDTIVKAATDNDVDPGLMLDMAYSEGNFKSDPPLNNNSKAQEVRGLYQWKKSSWDQIREEINNADLVKAKNDWKYGDPKLKKEDFNYNNIIGEDRTNPKDNAIMTAYALSKGKINWWNANGNHIKWSRNYTEKELKKYGGIINK